MTDRIIKYFENELNASQQVELLLELEENESLKKEFTDYRNALGLLALAEKPGDRDEGEQNFRQFAEHLKRNTIRRGVLRTLGYAASIALLIVGTYMATSRYGQYDILPAVKNKLHVPAGQRANITLSDGTDVWVNANSTIIYPPFFRAEERRVELIGEAFFQVTKDNGTPFVVSTDKMDVNVLGTIFNVRCYPGEKQASVSLIEGSVEVHTGNMKQILKPGEQLSNIEGNMSVSKLRGGNDFLWRQGVYTFSQIPLSKIMETLESYYDVEIVMKNRKIADIPFTGKFRQRDGIMDILKILQTVYPFKICRDEQNNVITIE